MSDDVRCWYLNQKGKAAGPFLLSELQAFSAAGKLKGHHLVFREGASEWKKAFDWPEVAEACFGDQARSSFDQVIEVPEEQRAVDDQWVLLVREDRGGREVRFRQRGPYPTEEVRRQLLAEKIKPSDHIWRKGSPGWRPLYEYPEFKVYNLKMTPEALESLREVESMPVPGQVEPPATRTVQIRGAQVFQPEAPSDSVASVLPEFEPEWPSLPESSESSVSASPSVVSEQVPLMMAVPPEAPLGEASFPPFPESLEPLSEAIVPEPVASSDVEPVVSAPLVVPNLALEPAPERRGWLDRAAPLFAVGLLATVALGVWATLHTDRSAFQRQSLAMGSSARLPSEVIPVTKTETPIEKPTGQDEPPVPVVNKPAGLGRKVNSEGDVTPLGPTVQVSEDGSAIEIGGAFRKGDLLRIRVEGRSGQILDLPALVLKLDVRALQDNIYRIALGEQKIPMGEYGVAVQYGMNRFQRTVQVGQGDRFKEQLNAHRKAISYDQQQEKGRLLKATRDFSGLLVKAEAQAKEGGAMNSVLKELEARVPKELRQIRQSRYELVYGAHWEKLGVQWEKMRQSLREAHPNRNPASVPEITRARKAASSIENEVRNTSIWE